MITYQAVEIGGKSYDALASVVQADDYLAAEPDAIAGAWRALTDGDDKGRNLVGATRIILRQSIRPEVLTANPQPPQLAEAAILLAAAMAGGYDAANQSTTASGIKRQKAGSVEQEFFYGAAGGASGNGFRFPLPVWELIRGLLGGGADDSGIGGSFSSGTCGRSITGIDYGFGGPAYSGDGYDSDNYDRAYD